MCVFVCVCRYFPCFESNIVKVQPSFGEYCPSKLRQYSPTLGIESPEIALKTTSKYSFDCFYSYCGFIRSSFQWKQQSLCIKL